MPGVRLHCEAPASAFLCASRTRGTRKGSSDGPQLDTPYQEEHVESMTSGCRRAGHYSVRRPRAPLLLRQRYPLCISIPEASQATLRDGTPLALRVLRRAGGSDCRGRDNHHDHKQHRPYVAHKSLLLCGVGNGIRFTRGIPHISQDVQSRVETIAFFTLRQRFR